MANEENWKLSSPTDFFVPPIKAPSSESFQDWEFVKTLAMFSQEMKGKLLPVARECLRVHMQAMKKQGEQPNARDLWFAKCMAARRLEEAKNRTDDDRRRDEVIRKEGQLMAKKIEAARAKGFSGEVRVDTNGKPPTTHSRDATKRQKLSKLPPQQHGHPTGVIRKTHRRTDQGDKSLRSHGECFQSDEDAPCEAPPRNERLAGLDGDNGELEDIPEDPRNASFDNLQALHVQKDRLYEAQEDYYCALRLQILARYQRMHMRYLEDVHTIESRAAKSRTAEMTESRGMDTSGRKKRRDTKGGIRSERRTSSRLHGPDDKVGEVYGTDQSDIEDRISFYNFGYESEDEHLTREEEVQLLPYDIDIAEIHAKRYELRDRFPGRYRDSETSLIASGRAFYAARRLKLWKMRQDATAKSARVEGDDQ